MPERVLQNDNCVAALQHRSWHSVLMSLPANEQGDVPVASTRRAADPQRARRFRAGLVLAALFGVCALAAGCGGGSSRPDVASLGATRTTTAPSAPPSGSKANPITSALGFAQCMRTHGEPNFPEPVFHGRSASIDITPSSGVDPNSPQFIAATNACKHLLPNKGVPSKGSEGTTITAADRADYLKATACMRSHGVPDFPDPTFQDNTVSFKSRTPIDSNSPQYKSALTTCQRLIPAGLPYSGSSSP